ncbi:hypothetical protein [Methanolobus sp. ZRKC5]|uniref:hypothetical protein n=1 Tax=unclassified Methanolobus TaxID=2629569 RepID=UPI00313C9D1F
MNENQNFNIHPDNLIKLMSNEKYDKSIHENFTLKYNGGAVESHEMNANDLAKSLMALSNVLERVTYITNGSNSNIFVKVKGSFKPGSFDVDLVTLLTCAGVQTVVNSVAIIGFIKDNFKSLIWFFKKTKGEKIESINHLDSNNIELILNNCEKITVNNYVLAAYQDKVVRKEIENFVSPLEDMDMSDITLLHNGIEQTKITRDERKYFYAPGEDVIVNKSTDYL